MPSRVDIANLALLKVGQALITTFDDDVEAARIVKTLFDQTVDEVFAAGRWRFATRQASLGQLTGGPIWNRYVYRYALPTDPFCLWVTRASPDDDRVAWEVQGREILTDAATVSIEYIARLPASSDWDPLFISALVERLAAELAIPITNTPSLRQTLYSTYLLKLQDAAAKGSLEGTPEVISDTILTDVR